MRQPGLRFQNLLLSFANNPPGRKNLLGKMSLFNKKRLISVNLFAVHRLSCCMTAKHADCWQFDCQLSSANYLVN